MLERSLSLAVASDHAGFRLKEALTESARHWGLEVTDLGVHDPAVSADYPDLAHELAGGVAEGRFERGLLVCGTGLGMSIVANRHRGVRAVALSNVYSARMSRAHNNANVLCLGERVVGVGLARELLRAFLDEPYLAGRHQGRLDKVEPG
ncbi:MAG: ribose 5-phosphate isomerase B [Proteobacteria bacterium]|nr:ribose 5-phosphate isomerase B [Pseudomonadota bacterium]